MKYPQNGETNWIALNYNGFSLRDVIRDGTSRATNVSATEWKKLLNNSDIQVKSQRSNILSWSCINFPSCLKTPVRKREIFVLICIPESLSFPVRVVPSHSKLISVELLTYVLETTTTTATVARRDRHTHIHTHKTIQNKSGRSINIQNTYFFRFIPRLSRENTNFFFLDEG